MGISRYFSFGAGGKLHTLKNLYLRLRYGAGCCDIYSLYGFLSPRILKSLRRFRENVFSHPAYMTEKEWNNALDEMIFAFEWYSQEDEPWDGGKNDERAQKGAELFGKHFRGLWL